MFKIVTQMHRGTVVYTVPSPTQESAMSLFMNEVYREGYHLEVSPGGASALESDIITSKVTRMGDY